MNLPDHNKSVFCTVQVNKPMTHYDIGGLLCCAYEGGSNYWAKIVAKIPPPDGVKIQPWDGDRLYPSIDYPLHGGAVIFKALDDPKEYALDRETIERGLRVMIEKHPRHWAHVGTNQEDAETGDVFLQCCLFGELVYG